MNISSLLSSLEAESFPGLGIGSKSVMRIINGKKVRATGRWNHGRSGKGFTTTWQINGVRVAKKDLEKSILS